MGKKKKKVEFTVQDDGAVFYGDTKPNSKKRDEAIAHMLKYTGRDAILKGKGPKLNKEDVIINYLIAEEYAPDEYSAISIMRHMSDNWLEHILYELVR